MKIILCYGTRPELIKIAPVYLSLRNTQHEVQLLSTGQHRELLSGISDIFGLDNIISLDSILPGSTVLETQINIQTLLGNYLKSNNFDLMLVHGDTSTTLGASLAAFANKTPLAHIEAGLRSFDLLSPWPEEGIRRIVDHLSMLRFAPTKAAFENLTNEGLGSNSFITGNTITDAVRIVLDKLQNEHYSNLYLSDIAHFLAAKNYILVTQHRRESFGGGFESVLAAIIDLAKQGLPIVWPIHPNPNVLKILKPFVSKYPNLSLIAPQPYPAMVQLISNAKVVISDSGGIQEEAPTLGIPLLITREKTERPEVLGSSNSILVGYSSRAIYENTLKYYSNSYSQELKFSGKSIYGDGHSSEKIIRQIDSIFS